MPLFEPAPPQTAPKAARKKPSAPGPIYGSGCGFFLSGAALPDAMRKGKYLLKIRMDRIHPDFHNNTICYAGRLMAQMLRIWGSSWS